MKCIYAEENANEIFTVTASPALFVIVIYSVGFPKKKTQQRQICNAIMLVRRPELIMCDWRKRAWTRKCGVESNGMDCEALSVDRLG